MVQVSCTMGFCGYMGCTLRAVLFPPSGIYKTVLRVHIPYTLEVNVNQPSVPYAPDVDSLLDGIELKDLM